MSRRTARVEAVHPADENHRVLSVHSQGDGPPAFKVTPCEERGPDEPGCPWRLDSTVGEFPAEAYRHSARTAYDMSRFAFACHQAGADQPKWCAGFLLRGAGESLEARLWMSRLDFSVVHSDTALYEDYVSMAVANGLAPDDPALAPCRGEPYQWLPHTKE